MAEELRNVSKACQVMGLSRDTFYCYKAAVDEGGVEVLVETNRRPCHRLVRGRNRRNAAIARRLRVNTPTACTEAASATGHYPFSRANLRSERGSERRSPPTPRPPKKTSSVPSHTAGTSRSDKPPPQPHAIMPGSSMFQHLRRQGYVR